MLRVMKRHPALAPIPLLSFAGPAFAQTAMPEQSLIRFERVALTCNGAAVRPLLDVRPLSTVAFASNGPELTRQSFRFRIDQSGRTLSIAKTDSKAWLLVDSSDLAPAIAATRFATGTPRTACEVTFQPVATPISQSNPADLAFYYAMPHRLTEQDRRVFDALLPAGSTCKDFPRPRVIHYADVDKVTQAPGTASYAVLRYDVDRAGRSVNIAALYSSGNAQLERAAVKAQRGSRHDGARIGCVARYTKQQRTVLALPPSAKATQLPPSEQTGECGNIMQWARPPQTTFPASFGRRYIEGWALIGFDIAPWGATGNLKVLASEPSAEFGEAARAAMSAALRAPSPTGASGCRRAFTFKMPAGTPATTDRDY